MAVRGRRLTLSPTRTSVDRFGASARPLSGRGRAMLSRKMRTIVVLVVTGIWATNIVAGILMDSYEADQAVNGIFMAIVGGLLAADRASRNKNGNGDDH
jgi:hypothetical protein